MTGTNLAEPPRAGHAHRSARQRHRLCRGILPKVISQVLADASEATRNEALRHVANTRHRE
ncbi:hypothetical protein ABT234_14335 [Streptomyces sp. NPDC001586]|uniref:hypothetical protein n=1 Tax=Streptomyces sp. NPDC001586 TaxID=3154387 RepID=UPI00331E4BF5